MVKEPFEISIPDDTLTDLHDRLSNTRWPMDFANPGWEYGTNLTYLKELTQYWLKDYDWRRQETEMNTFSHFKTVIDDVPLHFIHEPGKGPNPMPLILSHGWPWTFWDYYKVIRPLSDPASFGGDPGDSFDIVVPSLPGYGFSTPLTKPGINYWRTADLWVTLMQDVLGYQRFAAHGGDWGAFITAQLGHKYAGDLIGIHINLMAPLSAFTSGLPGASEYGPNEQDLYKRTQAFLKTESGYSALHYTKPQTLAYALNDSPVGLCSWILEKRRTWSDCSGDVEKRFTKDELLTTMMIYWVTQSFGTSARYYYEAAHNPWKPAHDRTPVVEAPTGVAFFPEEVIPGSKKWAEKYYNLQHWTNMPAGGHFAPMEEPQRLVDDIRKFFRPLRN